MQDVSLHLLQATKVISEAKSFGTFFSIISPKDGLSNDTCFQEIINVLNIALSLKKCIEVILIFKLFLNLAENNNYRFGNVISEDIFEFQKRFSVESCHAIGRFIEDRCEPRGLALLKSRILCLEAELEKSRTALEKMGRDNYFQETNAVQRKASCSYFGFR